jgi:hypothetical protein
VKKRVARLTAWARESSTLKVVFAINAAMFVIEAVAGYL